MQGGELQITLVVYVQLPRTARTKAPFAAAALLSSLQASAGWAATMGSAVPAEMSPDGDAPTFELWSCNNPDQITISRLGSFRCVKANAQMLTSSSKCMLAHPPTTHSSRWL